MSQSSRVILAAIVAIVGSRVIYAVTDFHDRLVSAPFNLELFLIDLAFWSALFFSALWIFSMIPRTRKREIRKI
jgi:hypothetical protein